MSIHIEHLVCEREVAGILGLSVAWLQRARWIGTGPRYVRVGGPTGRAIRYRLSDVESWIASNTVDSEGHP